MMARMEEESDALRTALLRSADALSVGQWSEVASRLDAVLGDERSAKRALRALARTPIPELDRWRVEVALSRTRAAALTKGSTSGLVGGAGLDDPEPHVRALALAASYLDGETRGAPVLSDAIDGGREVVAWITGRELEDPGAPHLRRNQLFFYDVAHRALSGCGWLSVTAAAARTAQLDRLATGARPPLEGIGGLRVARAVAEILAPKPTLPDLSEPSDAPSLIDLLWAESIRLAMPAAKEDARALARWLELLPAALASEWASGDVVSFAIWQMAPSLARALSQRGHDELLQSLERSIAGSGLGSAGVHKRVLRMLRWVPADRARRFVHRLAYATCIRQRKGASWVWAKGGLRSIVTAAPQADPSLALVERFFGPPSEPLPEPESLASIAAEITRELAGDEVVDAVDHWQRDEARRFLQLTRDVGKATPLVALLPDALLAALTLGSPAASALVDLPLATGRHGERYVAARAFAIGSRVLDVVAADDIFEVLVDVGPRLERVRAATDAIRAAARLGRSPRSEVQRCASAIEELPSSRFWNSLGAHLRASPAVLRLHVFDPGIPWELAPLAQGEQKIPLGLAVPCVRERGAISDSRRRPRSLLALFDPSMQGAEAEATQVAERWRAAGLEAFVAGELEEARAIGTARGIDVFHFAGHQGPADDTTPSLSLRGRALSLIDLESCFAGEVPALVFLHACSTIAPGRDGGLGGLQALLGSPFPEILGTLWDVTPPDSRLVLAFYDALASGVVPARALHAARVAVARSAAWSGWWPSYVLWSSRGL